MCDDYEGLSEAETPLTDALREILTLNDELRKLRAGTETTLATRKAQYESHVWTLNVMLADKSDEIAILRARLAKAAEPPVVRHVAEEMGLREGMATAAGLVAEKEPDQK